ncbi:MAG: nitrile hydratase subunit beta [Pseudomonadota bacterium]
MNGVHDMGGMHGFGPVRPEADEPVFHADWESRAFAMNLLLGWVSGQNLDASRHGLERLAPADYLGASYYARWALGIAQNALESGLATAEELAEGRVLVPPRPDAPAAATAEAALNAACTGGWYARDPDAPARFAVGNRVRARKTAPTGHTRLPRYVQGAVGTVVLVHAPHVLPDASAHGEERAEWLYAVRFAGKDLWGEAAEPGASTAIDAWESYLEPA